MPAKPLRNMRKGDSRTNMLDLANEGLREINILLRLEIRDVKKRLGEVSDADGCHISFTIPGKAVPKGRPRVVSGRTYTPKRTKEYEDRVKVLSLVARQSSRSGILEGPIGITLGIYGRIRGDLDNIAKSLLDGMNGVLYEDDRQVRSLSVERYDSEDPHVDVSVEVLS